VRGHGTTAVSEPARYAQREGRRERERERDRERERKLSKPTAS